jgi:CRP-like cAMP-binding protein
MSDSNDSTETICSTCPRRHYGLCRALLEIIGKKCQPSSIQRMVIHAKQHLFRQGDRIAFTFILREGWVQLYRMTDQGNRQVFPAVLPGEMVGLHVESHAKAPYSAVALQDCLICKIPHLIPLCLSDSKLAIKLAGICEYDTLTAEMYLANIAHCDARKRIAFLALELFKRMELRGLNNGLTITFPLKQADVADMLGLTSVHVSRTLENLREEGLLEVGKNALTILNYPAVCALVGEYLEPIGECDRQGAQQT